MEKVLITGASGFIGRCFIDELKKRNIGYIGIDCRKDEVLNIDDISILDFEKLKNKFIEEKPTVIVHMAAIASATYENISELYNINVVGTENILRSVRECGMENTRIVLMSTAGVYGNQGDELYCETLGYNPENHYSYSKMINEFLAKQYSELDIRIVRPFNIIGYGQNANFIVPKVVWHFANKMESIRLGNLKPKRDYVDVEFCVNALAEIALRKDVKHKVYNICSGIGHSVEEVIDTLRKISGHNPEIITDPAFIRKNEVWKMVGDNRRIMEIMGDKKVEDFETMIRNIYDEYRKNLDVNK